MQLRNARPSPPSDPTSYTPGSMHVQVLPPSIRHVSIQIYNSNVGWAVSTELRTPSGRRGQLCTQLLVRTGLHSDDRSPLIKLQIRAACIRPHCHERGPYCR